MTEAARKHRELVLESRELRDEEIATISRKLAMMLQYAETTSCRRRFILNYFGEDFDRRICGACDNCLQGHAPRDERGERLPAGSKSPTSSYHPKFGQGTVERAEKDLVTVLFPSVGYKTLLASAVSRAEAQIA